MLDSDIFTLNCMNSVTAFSDKLVHVSTFQGAGHIIGATVVNVKNAIIITNTVMIGSLTLGKYNIQ